MTAPVIVSTSTWRNSADTTTHGPITLPSGVTVGDLLVCVFGVDYEVECTPSTGWTLYGKGAYSIGVTGAIFWKIATGSDALTITTDTEEQSTAIVARISHGALLEGSVTSGNSTNPDPPSFTATSDPDIERLWIATYAVKNNIVCTAAPDGYSGFTVYAAANSAGASSGLASKTSTAQTENPGNFTFATKKNWVCWTLAVISDEVAVTNAILDVPSPLAVPAVVADVAPWVPDVVSAIVAAPSPLAAPAIRLTAPPAVSSSAPVVVSTSTWRNSADTSTHGPITLPSGIQPGDLLLCVFSIDGTGVLGGGVTASTGWTVRTQKTNLLQDLAGAAPVMQAIVTRLATGSEPNLILTGPLEQSSAIVYCIRGGEFLEWPTQDAFGVGYGSGSEPLPQMLVRSTDSNLECLWIATCSHDGQVYCTSMPDGYTNGSYGTLPIVIQGYTSNGVSTSSAYRVDSGIYGAPGAFTASGSEDWVAITLAVTPPWQAVLAIPSPLGAPALVGCFGDPQAIIATPGPLGHAPEVLAIVPPVALVIAPGPLGGSDVVGRVPCVTRIQVAGPLGSPAPVLNCPNRFVFMAAAGPLGARPQLRARHRATISGQIQLTAPLGTPRLFAQQRFVTPVDPPATGTTDARQRLLSDPFPLRRSSALPQYGEDVLLPWVFGRATLSPVALDTAGLEWLVADHPIVGITAVRDGSAAVTGWQLVQQLDATGTAVALLRLTQPPKDVLAVDVAGRRHPHTGALLEHPADIAEELLTACGWSVPSDAFLALRDAYPGVILGGVLQASVTLREAVSQVLGSVDADWSAHPMNAFTATPGASIATLTPALCPDASAESTHASLCNTLHVTYGYDWAADAPRGSLTVNAPEVLTSQGEIAQDLDLPWVRTARDALALATAALQRRARPLWSFRLSVAASPRYAPGDTLTLDHPWVPVGPVLVTTVDHTATGQTLSARRWAGAIPHVDLVSRGALLDAATEETLQVSYRDGVATFHILDDLGHPLANATVTLDDTQTRTTDRTGVVQFTTSRGVHTLLITALGYATQELEVTV